jgi:four helix bundle protein
VEDFEMGKVEYGEWEKTVPVTFKEDTLWKVTAYRYAMFLSDLAWEDVTLLLKDRRTISTADQLYRAVNSVGANIAEGYSRSTGKDRALFYQYALGSARESRDWYFKSRHILGDEAFEQRTKILTEIIRLLLTMIPQQRGRVLREDAASYVV